MTLTKEKNIGEIVAEDYRAAAVFKSFGIDFCCQGNRSIADACQTDNIEQGKLLEELNEALTVKTEAAVDYKSWPLDLLADYVEKKHHRYVDRSIPVLKQYLEKICSVHGDRHPELHTIKDEFLDSAGDLTVHMKKEELILFPFIRKMAVTGKIGESKFGSVENPVKMMMEDHNAEGERFRKIAELSNDYTPPADACNTYRVAFSLLKEYEDDLHTHIHLENNILLPKAITMEKELSKNRERRCMFF